MSEGGVAFRGGKEYRDFKLDQKVHHKLKNDCNYNIKSEYYFLLSNPEHLHLVLLLALRKISSEVPKRLAPIFNNIPEGQMAAFKEYFTVNQKRKQFNVPDTFQGIIQPIKYHQLLIEKHYKSFTATLINAFLEISIKGKLRIRKANSLENQYKGLNSSKCDNQDIFLIHMEKNQLLLACFSDKPSNPKNVRFGSSISSKIASSILLDQEEAPKSPEKQSKNEQKAKKEASPEKESAKKLRQQGEEEQEQQNAVIVGQDKQSKCESCFTIFLLLALVTILAFVPENSPLGM